MAQQQAPSSSSSPDADPSSSDAEGAGAAAAPLSNGGLGYNLRYPPNHNNFMRERRKFISKKSAHHPEIL